MDTEELAKEFMVLFAGLERAHGEYAIPMGTVPSESGKIKGKACTLNKPVTVALWRKHLSGEIGLGITPITENGTCMWGAIDLDIYENFDHAGLERRITAMGLPLVVCRTKSGGCHLFLFLMEPTKAKTVRAKLREFEMALGFVNSEIFPKQDNIESDKDFGSWVNMPYQKALLTMRFAVHDGKPIPPDRFVAYARSKAITAMQLTEFKVDTTGDDFSDAPPCLQHYVTVGFPQGSRNNALFSMGVYARKKYADNWEEKVFEYNQRFMGPGTYAEVKGIIRGLNKKTYVYKCSDQPLCSVCNKNLCMQREYGVGPKAARKRNGNEEELECFLDSVDRPVICYEPPEGSSDEPQWVFKIGGKQFDVSLDMINNQNLFLKEYLKKFHQIVLPVKATTWRDRMNELLQEAERMELPEDVGPEGQLLLHLEKFCTGKVQGRAQEDLLVGKPFTDMREGLTYFRSQDLMKYLDQQHFRAFTEHQLWAVLRRHDARNRKLMIKGKCVGCWSVARFTVQTEDLTPPDLHDRSPF